MAAINDLISQVEDKTLRERLQQEVDRLTKQKKFGLVFEEHIPECTPLYDIPVKKGSLVAVKDKNIQQSYIVESISDDTAVCYDKDKKEHIKMPVSDLVSIARFGDPIYPYLKPIDKVENAPYSNLWHTLIEADNYHALQLLEYLYSGKVDCIYIDPPYNTGSDEWKYNDAFVDSSDHWAHSKWLSMMKKRLKLANKLLSQEGVLVLSIGYQEVHQLNLLLNEIFPDKQVVTVTVQTSSGKPAGGFNYLQEYLVFVTSTAFKSKGVSFSGGKENSPYHGMTLATFTQSQRPNQTYPIYIDKNGQVVSCGNSLQERVDSGAYNGNLDDFKFDYNEAPEGTVAVWPVTSKGAPCVWRLIPSRFMSDLHKGYIKVIPQKNANAKNRFVVQYLSAGIIKKIENSTIKAMGRETINNTILLDKVSSEGKDIPTIWNEKDFYTSRGTSQIQNVFGEKEFQYPKPIDLIVEVLRACTNQNSLVLDFFAGSGTTLNAVNLLNDDDDGQRRCILVTNNEVAKATTKQLMKQGLHPGDDIWEESGICRAVTWPRTKYTILGKRDDGTTLEGQYLPNADGEERYMSDGFAANCEYFKLGFLDKNEVALGRQFKEILPLLWMKSGAIGERPEIDGEKVPDMMILPKNHFAVLATENRYLDFEKQLSEHPEIETAFIITDSESAYREIISGLKVQNTYQLYRDYLDNFRINSRR